MDRVPQRVTAEQYRLGMRRLAGAVSIVTASHAEHRFGMTATAVCSVSADPPALLACVNGSAATHAAILQSGAFCVNVLRSEDAALANTFSGSQTGEARFRSGEWLRLATGAPALASALASLDCRVVKTLEHGTHTIFLGEVQSLVVGRRGKGLMYGAGQYALLAPLAHGAPLPEGFDHWVDV